MGNALAWAAWKQQTGFDRYGPTDPDAVGELAWNAALQAWREHLYPIVCLCGSTRFARQFVEQNERLTLEGAIVLSVGSFGHLRAEPYTEGQKAALDALHLRKIDLAHRVLVLNVGGYVGESTRREIEYALAAGKPVDYLEPVP